MEINDLESILNNKKRERGDDDELLESLDGQVIVEMKDSNLPITLNIRDLDTEISKKQKLTKPQLLQSPNKVESEYLTPIGDPSVRAGEPTGQSYFHPNYYFFCLFYVLLLMSI
jgi:hypothetical protein